MTFLQRAPAAKRSNPSTTSSSEPAASPPRTAAPAKQVPLTRAGAAWIGVSAAALLSIMLIIFLVQNTHQVNVKFLWMSTSTSLALTLLIAAVGAVLLTVILGTTRMVQLRRIIRSGRSAH